VTSQLNKRIKHPKSAGAHITKAIQSLTNNPLTVIMPSDKNCGLTVVYRYLYMDKMSTIFSDTTTYSDIAIPEFNDFDHIPSIDELFYKFMNILDECDALYYTVGSDDYSDTAKYILQQQNDPKVDYCHPYGLAKVHKLIPTYEYDDIAKLQPTYNTELLTYRTICPNINYVTSL
jgi:hypothetical protein